MAGMDYIGKQMPQRGYLAGDARHVAWEIVRKRLALAKEPRRSELLDALGGKHPPMDEWKWAETLAVLLKLFGQEEPSLARYITDWELGMLYEFIDEPLFRLDT